MNERTKKVTIAGGISGAIGGFIGAEVGSILGVHPLLVGVLAGVTAFVMWVIVVGGENTKLSDIVLIIAILCFVVGSILWVTSGDKLWTPALSALAFFGMIFVGVGGSLKKKEK